MGLAETRTAVVKNLDELYWFIILSGTTPPTIVSARSVTQRIAATGASALGTPVTTAARGAGHTAAANKGYAVALTAIRSAAEITLDAKKITFVEGDPPGTAVVNEDDSAVNLNAVPTIAIATAGDMWAIVEQPPSYSGGSIPYVTAVSQEPNELKRDIRDKGQLQHRKKLAIEGGTLTLTALYENAKRGLSKYVDQDIIVIGEREDNRSGVVTEKLIFYGSRINAIPAPTEAEGDTDTNIVIPIRYELLAIVGEDYTA